MIVNKSLENIIISSVRGFSSSSILFSGPKGTLKTLSSELIIRFLIKDYEKYLPFSHPDIYVSGTYDFKLYYSFFKKYQEIVVSNELFREMVLRYFCFFVSNRNLTSDYSDTFDILSRVYKSKNINEVEKIFENFEEISHELNQTKSINIDTIREIINFCNKSSISGAKIVLITEFENATPEAQNALLKTLEEPQKRVFIILTTSEVSKVLPTIVSRTKVITFLKLPSNQFKETFPMFNLKEDYFLIRDKIIDDLYNVEKDFIERMYKALSEKDTLMLLDLSSEISTDEILVEKFFKIFGEILSSSLKVRGATIGLYGQENISKKDLLYSQILRNFSVSRIMKLQSFLDECYSKIFVYNMNPKLVISSFLMEVLA